MRSTVDERPVHDPVRTVASGWLAGRTAVVTGGANGLGAAIAGALHSAGARGAVLDLPETLHHAPPDGWVNAPVDLRDDESVRAAFVEAVGALGGIDILVAAAGVVPPWTDLPRLQLDDWDEVFRVNTRGVVATIQQALPAMGTGGAIVVIASLNAWRGDPNLMSYTASKHAVLGVVRSAAMELGRSGIRVNAVAPGPVATEAMLARLARRQADRGLSERDVLEEAAARTALGRIATAEDVAGAVLFLASDLSSGVTGHLLPVDAGIV